MSVGGGHETSLLSGLDIPAGQTTARFEVIGLQVPGSVSEALEVKSPQSILSTRQHGDTERRSQGGRRMSCERAPGDGDRTIDAIPSHWEPSIRKPPNRPVGK